MTDVPTKPAESQPLESQPLESQPLESQPLESQPLESQPLESQPLESQPLDARSGATAPLPPWARTAYTLLNASTAPVWVAMILAPRSRLTARLVATLSPLLAGLGITYSALLAAGVLTSDERPDFRDPDAIRRAMGSPQAFLAGWTHYLAFDLFVGRWIWEDALHRRQSARLPLLMTWMAGPAGLTLHLARRRRVTETPSPNPR